MLGLAVSNGRSVGWRRRV